ncbi:MAG: hypothetical protein IKI45_15660 [Oscillospiraceae bacterium]|nr:hypothetical protein [Oscillospiraceae bacterium]
MRTIKKAIAVLSSVAAAAVVTAGALSAFAFDPVDLKDRASEMKSGLNLIADEVYAEPGETVLYNVYIQNNTGYAASGIGLVYDQALSPVIKESNDRPDLTYGDGSYMLSKSADYSAAEHRIGVGTMGDEDCTRDGIVFTAKFVVPADAKENDEFKLTLDIDKFLNEKTDKVDYSTVDGWIRIRKKAVTTTATSVTTTVTTSDTTSVTVPTTTTAPVTVPTVITTSETVPTTSSAQPTTVTTTITTDVSTVSNTSKTDREDPGSEPTTASRKNNGGAQTTKAPASSTTTTKTTATKTGDAGVGVAAAALMLSAATAVTFKRKKH